MVGSFQEEARTDAEKKEVPFSGGNNFPWRFRESAARPLSRAEIPGARSLWPGFRVRQNFDMRRDLWRPQLGKSADAPYLEANKLC
ncbi:hypothetical protein [Phaeobacter italicus]|uniref:hypothetical protein n=1 Tax=Phaeobacter italicus TaxID=481446 RepID=UPI00232AD22A|nr:hypothetical protein [Phaeobacter italicus]